MKAISVAGFIVILIIVSALIPNQPPMQVYAQTKLQREVTIPVKVVFVGIDPSTVDTGYMRWGGNVPSATFGAVYFPQPNLTGVVYKVDYSFTFAGSNYKSELLSYLRTIGVTKEGPNPWFYSYSVDPSGYVYRSRFFSLKYEVYDANKVEDWIYNHQQEVGGFPSNGWTLMFLNLPELPSYSFEDYKDFLRSQRQEPPNGTAHYYGVEYRDSDLGYQLRYRDYMTGWGGVHRLWFNDLSAAPSFVTGLDDLPLQIALEDNRMDLTTSYGKTWFTQYLSDYISQTTLELVTPWLLYPPTYSEKYSFNIHVFDNRTAEEKSEVDIRSTIDSETIRNSFQDLLPYSNIDVKVTFEDLSKYTELQRIIISNYRFADSFTMGTEFASPQEFGVVDAKPIYKYLLDNMRNLEPKLRRDRSEQTIPVFALAFSEQSVLGFTNKWSIDPVGGVALGDLAIIGSNQFDFTRGDYISPPQPNRGFGFTQVVVHEAGHLLGLTHPHDFGSIGDFSLSPMGYFTYDYTFGVRDKDLIRRAHVDVIYLEVESMLGGLPDSWAVRDQLKDVDAKYSKMQYVEALESVLNAEKITLGRGRREPWSIVFLGADIVASGVTYVAVGLVVGFAIAWFLLKRKAVQGTPQPSAGLYCTNCGRPVPTGARFCYYCGQQQFPSVPNR